MDMSYTDHPVRQRPKDYILDVTVFKGTSDNYKLISHEVSNVKATSIDKVMESAVDKVSSYENELIEIRIKRK